MRPRQQVEVYPDGVVEIYEDSGRKLVKRKGRFNFENQSVGVIRYYQADTSVSGNRIDRVIKIPHTSIVDRLNIAVVTSEGDRQYRILRIQNKPERGVDLLELQSVTVSIKKEETV